MAASKDFGNPTIQPRERPMIDLTHFAFFDEEYAEALAKTILAIEFEYRKTLMELVAGKTGRKFDLLAKTMIRINRENKRGDAQ